MSTICILTPSLKTTGGNKELVRLAQDLVSAGADDVRIVAMWKTENEVASGRIPVFYLNDAKISRVQVFFGLLSALVSFRKLVAEIGRANWVLSHYLTYSLTPMISRSNRWFFVQDLEWNFVPTLFRPLLRWAILGRLRQGRVLVANDYLGTKLHDFGVPVITTAAIWADKAFLGKLDRIRDVDVVLMMRTGSHKRADLVKAFIAARDIQFPEMNIIVITPDDHLAQNFTTNSVTRVFIRPELPVMRDIYERSKIFLLLSDHEGFGLPPLESMGAGCVPLCRDAGGVRAYMRAELEANIMPLSLDVHTILNRVVMLLSNDQELSRQRATSIRIFREGLDATTNRHDVLARCGIL